jgi:hypothetical protein
LNWLDTFERLEENFVYEAPAPVLTTLFGTNEWVLGGVEVGAGVTIL